MTTRNHKILLACLTLVFSIANNSSNSWCIADSKLNVNISEKGSDVINKAIKLSKEIDATGKRLINILSNKKIDVEKRIKAGLLLGELNYMPAIPALIKNINLTPVNTDEPAFPPLHMALAKYGEAAVPSIVRECLKNDSFVIGGGILRGHSILPLYMAILKGKTVKTARIYALGIGVESEDQKMKEKTKLFINELSTYQKTQ